MDPPQSPVVTLREPTLTCNVHHQHRLSFITGEFNLEQSSCKDHCKVVVLVVTPVSFIQT